MNANVVCPYCENQQTIAIDVTESEQECIKCKKKFLLYIGTVRTSSGLQNWATGIANIRLKKIENESEEVLVQFYCTTNIEASPDDVISVSFKKAWPWSKEYWNHYPTVVNYTLGTHWVKV